MNTRHWIRWEEIINKADLVQKVAPETGGSKTEASRYLEAILSAVEEELGSGGEVNIAGFGKFEVNERAAREGINPQTGEKMQIKASSASFFSAGNVLKESLN